MANNKTSLEFYTVDTDRYQDIRIKRLKREMGCKGLAVYDYILCEIYRVKGCYVVWDENTVYDVAEYLGLEENTVKEVVMYCGYLGLFDKTQIQCGIITSAAIQRRYTEMCVRARRKSVVIPEQIRIAQTDMGQAMPHIIEDKPYELTLSQELDCMSKEEEWLGEIQVLYRIDREQVRKHLEEFGTQCRTDGKERHQSLMDAKKHFNSWLRIITKKHKEDDNVKTRNNRQAKRRGNVLAPDEAKKYDETF